MNAAATITHREEAKQRSRYRFMTAVADRQKAANQGWLGRAIGPSGWPAKLARTAIVALGIVVLGTGTAYGATVASEDSVPGDPLYAVKTLKEDISLRMPKSDLARAKEHARLANVRTEEIGALIDRGRLEQANKLVVRVTYHLNSSAQLVGVTITAHANPLEMPADTTPVDREQRIAELVAYYEAKAQQVRNPLRVANAPPASAPAVGSLPDDAAVGAEAPHVPAGPALRRPAGLDRRHRSQRRPRAVGPAGSRRQRSPSVSPAPQRPIA